MAKVVATGRKMNGRDIFTLTPTHLGRPQAQRPFPNADDRCPRSQPARLFPAHLTPTPTLQTSGSIRVPVGTSRYHRQQHKQKPLALLSVLPLRGSTGPFGYPTTH